MSALRILPPEASRILKLAAKDRAQARQALAGLTLDEQVALVCETPVSRRAELLDLVPAPEALVPALPPAELCHTAKAVGLADAAWFLEHASEEQIAACVDLDAWEDFAPDRARLGEWLLAFQEAEDEALLRAVRALDMELLVLHLLGRVVVHTREEGDDEFVPPPGSRTLDGQFHLLPVHEEDDLADVIALLRLLFDRDLPFYFRLMQAAKIELLTETEEWALRWRLGRLEDLGFPPFEESMRIYGHLRREKLRELSLEPAAEIGEWPLPVWLPNLPAEASSEYALLRALAELSEEERRPLFPSFLALVNRVAVADRLPLGEAETLRLATEKVLRVASRGLEFLAQEHGLATATLVQRVPLERLFRVGVNLAGGEELPPGGGA